MATLYTVGHSTRSLEEFLETLRTHGIANLIDVRSIPMSRRLPHFNREALESSLSPEGINYLWMKELGGRRKKTREDSPHIALRSPSFRNYADHMLSQEFQEAAAKLITLGGEARTAYMCAERVYFRCHRMMISDWLVAKGHLVLHIDGVGPTRSHHLMPEARLINGQLIYRGDLLL